MQSRPKGRHQARGADCQGPTQKWGNNSNDWATGENCSHVGRRGLILGRVVVASSPGPAPVSHKRRHHARSQPCVSCLPSPSGKAPLSLALAATRPCLLWFQGFSSRVRSAIRTVAVVLSLVMATNTTPLNGGSVPRSAMDFGKAGFTRAASSAASLCKCEGDACFLEPRLNA